MATQENGEQQTRAGARHPLWPFLLMAHIALVAVLFRAPWYVAERFGWAVIAVPLSQNSLIALWAATSGRRALDRWAIAGVGVAVTWILACGMMSWAPYETVAAGWSTALVSQSVLILLAFDFGRMTGFSRVHGGDAGGNGPMRRRWQFSLRTLLLYVTAIAVLLGTLRVAITYLGWTVDLFFSDYSLLMPVIGACNAGVAISAYGGVAGTRPLLWRTVRAWLEISAVGLLVGLLLPWLAAGAGDATLGGIMTLVLSQGAILQATLWPLRREILEEKEA